MNEGPSIEQHLRSLPLFAGLSEENLALLARQVSTLQVAAGKVIFELGDPGDELFIVQSGRVQIYLPSADGPEEIVAELASGQWFGEMALITGEPRSAGARASEPTSLLCLARTDFQLLLAKVSELALTLSQELSRRLRAHLLRPDSRQLPSVILLEDPSLSPEGARAALALARAVAEELDGKVALIESSSMEQEAAPPAGETNQVVTLPAGSCDRLEQLTRAHVALLVRATAGDELSARARAAALRSSSVSIEEALAAMARPAAKGLLVQPMQQLARRILQKRVGLVLGAGAAKSLAHVGALRCFEAAGVRFDMFAGTSFGACIAGAVALGWSSQQVFDACRDLTGNFRRRVLDFGIPSGSLLRGRKKRDTLRSFVGDHDLSDLPVPLRVVAADLVTGREVVLERGPLWEALDATTAIPTVFPPVVIGERVLVDGWVVNPFPCDVLRRAGANVIIGVEPSAADDREQRLHRPKRPRSSWRRWLDPRRLIDPAGIVRVAMRAMDVGARERMLANLGLADVCVQPRLAAYSITDVQKFDEIVSAGELAARESMSAIFRSLRAASPQHRA